jgi:hypothetical protein
MTTDVYVDPEDWSGSRTRTLPPLRPGTATTLTFEMQAVSAGRFSVYVVVLPNGVSSAGTGTLAVSPPNHVTVAGRKTLSAGGALPVVVTVPVLLGLALAIARIWLRGPAEGAREVRNVVCRSFRGRASRLVRAGLFVGQAG